MDTNSLMPGPFRVFQCHVNTAKDECAATPYIYTRLRNSLQGAFLLSANCLGDKVTAFKFASNYTIHPMYRHNLIRAPKVRVPLKSKINLLCT